MISKPVIYIQVNPGYLSARRVGGASTRMECAALDHPRTLMGDYFAVEAAFRTVCSELAPRRLLAAKPAVVVHLMPDVAGGYTNVEQRAFEEAAAGAGARACRVVTGSEPLSDARITETLR